MPGRPYVLIASSGLSPQVVTELIQVLADPKLGVVQEPRYPRAVHLVTTGVGERFARALLLGEPGRYLKEGVSTQITPCGPHWDRFCEEVLGVLKTPPDLQIHTAKDSRGRPIEDIRDEHDDGDFADEVFTRVAELGEPDERLDMVGVIAGGRKNMSGHLQNAFSVWARPDDLLFHVVVSPPEFERSDFFYKRPTDPDHARVEIHPIAVTFPRLYPVIRKPILEALRPDARTQRDILDRLDDFLVVAREPALGVLRPTPDGVDLSFADERGEHVTTVHLRPAEAATLVVLAELTRHGEQPVYGDTLLTPEAAALRSKVYGALYGTGGYEDWHKALVEGEEASALTTKTEATEDDEALFRAEAALQKARNAVSTSIGALRTTLDAHLYTKKWLSLPHKQGRLAEGRYVWEAPIPPLFVDPPYPVKPWPFKHVNLR